MISNILEKCNFYEDKTILENVIEKENYINAFLNYVSQNGGVV